MSKQSTLVSPLLSQLHELEEQGKIKVPSARSLRRQITMNHRKIASLATQLNDTVPNILGQRKGYLTCYARGRHLFLDLQGGMVESGEFYIAAALRDCYVMEDVCVACATRKQVRLSKRTLTRMGRPSYFRPAGFDLAGVNGCIISRADAAPLLMHERFELILQNLAGRRLWVASGQ